MHPDAGPLGYYCGSPKVDTLGFFDWGHGHINLVDCYEAEAADRGARYVAFLKRRVKELDLEPRHFLPKKGDILVWHGALVHTGPKMNDQRRTRKALVGHFTSVANHYRLDENHVNGGFVLDLPERYDVRTYERSLRGAARRTRTQMRRAYWSLRASVRRRASRPR